MNQKEILDKIMGKKEFSQLPLKDVQLAYSHFEKKQVSDNEKVRLTRELLHRVFGAFGSRKILGLKYKSAEWVLGKHLSAKERAGFYRQIYSRILKDEKIVIDLGAGINGFSYSYFKGKPRYVAIESVGQFVDLMNQYFKEEDINGRAIHTSLFELKKVKKILLEEKGKKIVFLFKVIDALESLEKNYSKKFLLEIAPLTDRFVLSFSLESMIRRKKFHAERKWLIDFIKEHFKITDDFEIKGERFLIFEKKR